jgi:predicted amidophosphoribosyltransferase
MNDQRRQLAPICPCCDAPVLVHGVLCQRCAEEYYNTDYGMADSKKEIRFLLSVLFVVVIIFAAAFMWGGK